MDAPPHDDQRLLDEIVQVCFRERMEPPSKIVGNCCLVVVKKLVEASGFQCLHTVLLSAEASLVPSLVDVVLMAEQIRSFVGGV